MDEEDNEGEDEGVIDLGEIDDDAGQEDDDDDPDDDDDDQEVNPEEENEEEQNETRMKKPLEIINKKVTLLKSIILTSRIKSMMKNLKKICFVSLMMKDETTT